MRCRFCNNEIPDLSTFCKYCGQPVPLDQPRTEYPNNQNAAFGQNPNLPPSPAYPVNQAPSYPQQGAPQYQQPYQAPYPPGQAAWSSPYIQTAIPEQKKSKTGLIIVISSLALVLLVVVGVLVFNVINNTDNTTQAIDDLSHSSNLFDPDRNITDDDLGQSDDNDKQTEEDEPTDSQEPEEADQPQFGVPEDYVVVGDSDLYTVAFGPIGGPASADGFYTLLYVKNNSEHNISLSLINNKVNDNPDPDYYYLLGSAYVSPNTTKLIGLISTTPHSVKDIYRWNGTVVIRNYETDEILVEYYFDLIIFATSNDIWSFGQGMPIGIQAVNDNHHRQKALSIAS